MSETNSVLEQRVNISFSLNEAITLQPVLQQLGNQRGLPTKTAYRIARLLTKVGAYFVDFDKSRLLLLERLGEKIEPDANTPPGTQNYLIADERQEEFNNEMASLLSEQITLNNFIPLSLSSMERADLTPADIQKLMVLLQENLDDDAIDANPTQETTQIDGSVSVEGAVTTS